MLQYISKGKYDFMLISQASILAPPPCYFLMQIDIYPFQ